jgi:hypothetical protein
VIPSTFVKSLSFSVMMTGMSSTRIGLLPAEAAPETPLGGHDFVLRTHTVTQKLSKSHFDGLAAGATFLPAEPLQFLNQPFVDHGTDMGFHGMTTLHYPD